MARLLVLRGESLDSEIELAGRTVRIGRSADNDLVLEDPGKSVSRNHAEIRYERGRYTLVDLDSQNGVWVAGARVPYVVLEPNVVASVGPFRLMLDTGASASAGPNTDRVDVPDTGQYYSEPDSGSIPGQAGAQRSRVPSKTEKEWYARPLTWLLAGGGLVLAGAIAVVIRLTGGPPPNVEQSVEKMLTLVTRGDCDDAQKEFDDLQVRVPGDPRMVDWKTKVETCAPPAATTTSTPDLIAEQVARARELLNGGDCAAAKSAIDSVIANDPNNVDAQGLKGSIDACLKVASGGTSTPAPPKPCGDILVAKRIAPEQGGLEPTKCEPQANYDERVRLMQARYNEAAAALSNGDLARASLLFGNIAREVPTYRDAAGRAAEAQKRQGDDARRNLAAAKEFEAKNEPDRALDAYKRAHDLDPSIVVDADIARVQEAKSTLGRTKCEQAAAAFAYNRNAQGQQLWQEAVKLLPPDHPCLTKARNDFPNLRR